MYLFHLNDDLVGKNLDLSKSLVHMAIPVVEFQHDRTKLEFPDFFLNGMMVK